MATNSVEPVAANGSEEPIIARHAEVRSDVGSRASGVAVAALIISIVALGAVIATLLLTLHRQQSEEHPAGVAAASSPQQAAANPAPQSQPAPTSAAPQASPSQAQSKSSQAASDEAMQRELNMKLATDPQLAFHPLDATVQNGRVRLRGALPNERLKERTESIAKSIRGVKEISNQISIQPG
jgi:hyperosmotically inducible protein